MIQEKTISTTLMLTDAEARKLVDSINLNVQQAGVWLREYRDREGWKAMGYQSFKDACRKEFSEVYGSRSQIYLLMQQADVSTNVDAPLPIAQTKLLGSLPPEQQQEAFSEAVEEAMPEPPTTAHIKASVERTKSAGSSNVDEEKYEAALDRLAALLGKPIAKNIRDGTLGNVDQRAAIYWASLTDEQAKSIKELVVAKRWTPKDALTFLSRQPTDRTRIGDLHNLAIAQGGATSVSINGFVVVCYNGRKFAEEGKRIDALLGIQ